MIEIKSRLESVASREKWAARGASFVAKAKATKTVWFPPEPVEAGKTVTKKAAKKTAGAAKKSTKKTANAAKKTTGTAKKATGTGRKATAAAKK